MRSLWLLRVPSSVGAKRRKSWLLAASALASSSMGVSEPALAQTCTPDPSVFVSGNATCTGAFTSNINYSTTDLPIHLTLQPPISVTSPGGNAVNLNNTFVASPANALATLTANDATINNINNPSAPNQSALRVQASGNATITASGIINVIGTDSTNAVWAIVFSSGAGRPVASVTYDGPATGPGITATGGANSTLIQACANDGCNLGSSADADVNIVAAGNLTGIGPSGPVGNGITGLFAVSGARQCLRALQSRHDRRERNLCQRHLRGW